MAARATGFAMLASGSVQEAMDLALIAQAATLEARVPFLHFFDGFRTSHEVAKIEPLAPAALRAMIRDDLVRAHRARALSPDHPVIRGTAQNPDVYFQARETVNPYYLACPTIVQSAMDRLAGLVGRRYRLFDYAGAPDAERVIVLMGSGAETAQETVEHLVGRGEKVGVLRVRLYRPFSAEHFLAALPATVRTLAVLDRTKEPGSVGEPLYLDVVATMSEAVARGRVPFSQAPRIIGGRYGLGSKEFTPAMVKGIFDEMAQARPRTHFTIGIQDDVTHTSLAYDAAFSTEDPATVRAIFYGLGSDGTVGANKNSIKIIGEQTDNYAQGYFVYDSKKSGSVTVSHLRFGPQPIRSTYLISRATFVACHQFSFLERFDVLREAEPGAVFLLNSPYGADAVWDHLPADRPAADHRQAPAAVRHRRQPGRARGGDGRARQHGDAGLLLRHQRRAAAGRGHRRDQARHREDLRRRGAAVVREELGGGGCRARAPRRGDGAGNGDERRGPAATRARRGARVRPGGHRPDDRRGGRHAPGERAARPTARIRPGPPGGRSATSRWRSRRGTRRCASSAGSACWSALTRSSGRRSTRPPLLEGAPAAFKSAPARWREFGDARFTLQVSARGLHGLWALRRGVPGQEQERGAPQGHRHGAAGAAPRPGGGELASSSSSCPRRTGTRSTRAR